MISSALKSLLGFLRNLNSRPPLQRGAVRAGGMFLILIPVTLLFNYAMGMSTEWSVATFVEMGIVSIIYAVVVHYLGNGRGASDSQKDPSTTRSPR
jgi:H+/Cl- antiporter ClcA